MIPLFKVAMDQPAIEAAVATLQSGYIGQGSRVEEFEAAFGSAVGAPVPPLSVCSGTAALSLALRLIGVGPGDEVVTTPMTCAATNAPIVMAGASIVWADVDPVTGLISPESVKSVITPKTKAIIAVDWGGRPCDYDALRGHGIPVIEDAAHAFMATYRAKSIAKTGGDYVVWSFQAIKHLTTVDGGALLAPREEMERGRLLRWYGLDRRSSVSFRAGQNIREVGTKWHMNDVAAAIGLGNIDGAQQRVSRCRQNAEAYGTELSGLPTLTLPPSCIGSAWWLYTVLVEHGRDAFVSEMARRGVECGTVHARNDFHDGFREHVVRPRPLPGVDAFAARQVAIPVGWWVGRNERQHVVDAVMESLGVISAA